MPRKNIIGRQIAYWRYQNNWTQKMLEARLQCLGYNITREMLANIETGMRGVKDDWLVAFQKVFRLPIIRLFPKETQDFDGELAQRGLSREASSGSPGKGKHPPLKCKKLTKRRSRG